MTLWALSRNKSGEHRNPLADGPLFTARLLVRSTINSVAEDFFGLSPWHACPKVCFSCSFIESIVLMSHEVILRSYGQVLLLWWLMDLDGYACVQICFAQRISHYRCDDLVSKALSIRSLRNRYLVSALSGTANLHHPLSQSTGSAPTAYSCMCVDTFGASQNHISYPENEERSFAKSDTVGDQTGTFVDWCGFGRHVCPALYLIEYALRESILVYQIRCLIRTNVRNKSVHHDPYIWLSKASTDAVTLPKFALQISSSISLSLECSILRRWPAAESLHLHHFTSSSAQHLNSKADFEQRGWLRLLETRIAWSWLLHCDSNFLQNSTTVALHVSSPWLRTGH